MKKVLCILTILSIALIFGPSAVKAYDTISEIDIPPITIELRYDFTDEDIFLLTQLLVGDKSRYGDGEYDFTYDLHTPGREINHLEISKVLEVVMNRIQDDRFPNTIKEVVLAPNQFVVFPRNLKADPCPQAVEVVRDWTWAYARYSEPMIPEDHVFFRTGPNLTNVTRASYK